MLRLFTVSVCFACLVAACDYDMPAMPSFSGNFSSMSLPGGSNNDDIRLLLQRPCRVRLEGETDPTHNLQRAVEWIRQSASRSDDRRNTAVEVNWPSLKSAGASPETPINLRIERTTLAQALRAILQIASADYQKNPIDYRVHNSAIHIASRYDLYQMINQTRIYNVRDLLVLLSDYNDLPGYTDPAEEAQKMTKPRQREVMVGGVKVLVEEQPKPVKTRSKPRPMTSSPSRNRSAVVKELVSTIQSTVGRPEDWQYGSVHEINGDLVVNTTDENHAQIKDMLKDLRKSRAKSRKILESRLR